MLLHKDDISFSAAQPTLRTSPGGAVARLDREGVLLGATVVAIEAVRVHQRMVEPALRR